MTCQIDSMASSANVTIITSNQATFQEAYQFDDEDDTTWSFTGATFEMNIAGNLESAALLQLTSGAGQIVVDDVVLRILHFNVSKATLTASLVPGSYLYSFIMTIGSVRTPLMHGDFILVDDVG